MKITASGIVQLSAVKKADVGNKVDKEKFDALLTRLLRAMAECDWAILCDHAFLDVSRKMCIIGAFDRVFAPAVPSALHQSSLAMKLLGNPGETIKPLRRIIRPSE